MNITIGIKLKQRYEIIKEIGEGSFGHTYLARDTDLPTSPLCVVKELKADYDPRTIEVAIRLFETEAITLHKLGKHSQIPELFAHFYINNNFFLVQEFIEGHDLTKEIIYQQKWSELAVINLLKEILEVLVIIHQNNIVHRDLKPANLMRRKSDNKIVIIDFGAVKQIIQEKIPSTQTLGTVIIGTEGFMPDEQANGKPVFASDIYALGIIAIEALTGLYAFNLPKPPNIHQLNQDLGLNLSLNFQNILSKMVAEYHLNRYQNAQETLNALLQLNNSQKKFRFTLSKTINTPPKHNLNQGSIEPTKIINTNESDSKTKVVAPKRTTYEDQKPIDQNNFNYQQLIIIISIVLSLIGSFFLMNKSDIFSSTKVDESTKQDNSTSENEPLSPIISPKYQKLETQLKNGNWQEADLETNKIMLSLVGRENEANFTTTSINNFPCEDLKTINELWLKHSQQKFGFTTQKDIYLSTGNNIGEYKAEKYSQFIQQIGWNNYDLSFTEDVPKGHLPAPLINGYDDVWHDDVGLLFTRLQACDL
ncbi:serine/threonine-protein kinase [Geminocystis herdmanii]|uniref:serine/threonine-protein kinase n=1 Tax=Geminocystis herdmanii TaxID=669359 RepID=UPI00034A68E3|nr:serine/threonine-protein kinase [Geminocystis herdmanii]